MRFSTRLFLPTRLAGKLCRTVQDFLEAETGHAYDVLILLVPPQHGKSTAITEALPSWYLGKWPEKRVIVMSYNKDFAETFGQRNREKLQECGREIFNVQLKPGSQRKTDYELAGHRGSVRSRGVDGGITGNACDLMIIDDPVKNRQEADSPTYRRRLQEEWHNSYKTRLSAGAKVILIQTPWHEEDLAGYLQRTEQSVQVLRIPCECESEDDPLGRRIGEALCPELGKGQAWLASYKAGMVGEGGARAWNALFQCRPSSEEGNLIRRSWWRWYDPSEPPKTGQQIISVDAAFKGSEEADFVAIQCWGKSGPNAYLLDQDKRRMDFPETLRAVRTMALRYPAARPIYIEDKANGPAVIAMLRREIPGIIPVNPMGGKVARVNAVSGWIEAGNVFLPRGVGFGEELAESCAAFPRAPHDDDVDAMSQALNKLYPMAGDIVEEDEEEGPDYGAQLDNMMNY